VLTPGGRLLTRRPLWFVAAWVVLAILGILAALGMFGGQGLFDRLASGDAGQVRARAPIAGAVVVLAGFVLLFLLTGSLLVPLKALLLNVVSLGASLSVLVWVFQQGHLSGVLGFDSTGGIETVIPVLLVALGFGLSMDYEVFLLARIKELRDGGMRDDQAVGRRGGRHGCGQTLVEQRRRLHRRWSLGESAEQERPASAPVPRPRPEPESEPGRVPTGA
jgi:hypothetical protein